MWPAGAVGIVFTGQMKGTRDAKATKDVTIERRIWMADAVGQLVAPFVTGLTASAFVRWAKSWLSDVHGGGGGTW
ncbi:hypothetical protein EET67_25245 [Pseudaminobacter arsenicus]|uniref:Uncharacterized protein n=1 Tax=Borborobacter arsenicus TaxID=1851146 RepID=A0A432UZ11_9HYPH|nr:hypothetical protein [Pseudaminobacter arsenicus]RUM95098.1 hypothetical protein EET67_25245 [Pseudaminobacter arsenicus]